MRFKTSALIAAVCLPFAFAAAEAQTMQDALDKQAAQIRDQLSGIYYGEMPQMPAGQLQKAWGTSTVPADQIAQGVKIIPWSPEMITHVRLRTNVYTTFKIPDWDTIQTVWVPEKSTFTGAKTSPTTAEFTASFAGRDTNGKIYGKSGNIYQIWFTATDYNAVDVPDLSVTLLASPPQKILEQQFALASDPAASMPASAPSAAPQAAASSPAADEPLFRDLDIKAQNPADAVIAPARVWRSAFFTWLEFDQPINQLPFQPSIALVVDGVDQYVYSTVEGNRIKVHGIGPLALTSGQHVVCIVPQPGSPLRYMVEGEPK